jgi:hypothetical protein
MEVSIPLQRERDIPGRVAEMAPEHVAEAVAMLMLSRLDYLPGLRTATGSLRALPGPAESQYVPCQECAGSGRRRGIGVCIVCRDRKRAGQKLGRQRHGCQPCPSCDGQGERKRRKGEEAYDAYADKPLAELESEIRDAWLEAQGKRRVKAATLAGQAAAGAYRWELERARYFAAGSYAELERALERLRRIDQPRYGQVLRWAELGGDDGIREDGTVMAADDRAFGWTALALHEVRGTLEMLGEMMEKPIRVPRWVVLSWEGRRRRDLARSA